MSTTVSLISLSRRMGSVLAVDDVTLTARAGEMLFLLGPSGGGKTTLLRLIAGLVKPTSGRVEFDGRDMAHVAPSERGVGMVFQSSALWPHATALENVSLALRGRGVKRADRRKRAAAALESVGLAELASRKPATLSGGEQQRVALARALVNKPRVLLLDEPLSHLDEALKRSLRDDLRALCRDLGVTTIHVTHDATEALSEADRVAVMQRGRIVQCGTARETLASPRSRFVAELLGEVNALAATVGDVEEEEIEARTAAGSVWLERRNAAPDCVKVDAAAVCLIRTRAVRRAGERIADERNVLTVKVLGVVECGAERRIMVQAGPERLDMVESAYETAAPEVGGVMWVWVAPAGVALVAREDSDEPDWIGSAAVG